ncbi:hypothetical protein J7E73_29235 [Paenibacillus albidus]|uniref:hypothetical protein n=1 Tax=Paenibacillus albidus TaxID=2041023 RepID=UPI001BE634A2|nr:hypothetical protein [Paenibacillus albidus]MBT2293126.1 hypothetical protein [Paenibacillus albidus]
MTKNLTINISGMTTDDLLDALVEVQKKVEQEYLSGADRNCSSKYLFEVYS